MGFFDYFTGTKHPEPGTEVKPQAELRSALLALNRDTAPWQVRQAAPEEKCDLVVEWRIVDAKWYEVFGKAGLKSVFKILLKFDVGHNEVRALDQEWSVEWHAGVPQISVAAQAFRGQKTEVQFGLGYGFTEKGKLGEIYNYRFSTGEMKTPVKEAIVGAGWTYRAVVFGKL